MTWRPTDWASALGENVPDVVDNLCRVRSAIDVVTEEHERILGVELRELRHESRQVVDLTVDVTDRNSSCHEARYYSLTVV